MVISLHEHLRDLLLCQRTRLHNPVHDMAAQISTIAAVLDALRASELASMYIWLYSNAPSAFFPY
mgnify:FL=1|jgi:hypothetical protein